MMLTGEDYAKVKLRRHMPRVLNEGEGLDLRFTLVNDRTFCLVSYLLGTVIQWDRYCGIHRRTF